ncbi:hypothetical protein N8559_05530 [Gammaproteobacteria bacterium]|nr:hypothetical protein [Gammaproteobacteria bacterium]
MFHAAKERLHRERQKFAAKQLPKDYLELIDKRIKESPYSGGGDYPGPHYMVYNHYHVDLGTKDLWENHGCSNLPENIRCCCSIIASFDRSYLVKLAQKLKSMGFVAVLGEVSLNEPIPNRISELPIRELTIEQAEAAGFLR